MSFSNFSAFIESRNSTAVLIMIGNKLVVFHDADTTKYMDLPACYEKFCIPMDRFDEDCLETVAHLNDNIEEIDEYIAARHLRLWSDRFWTGCQSVVEAFIGHTIKLKAQTLAARHLAGPAAQFRCHQRAVQWPDIACRIARRVVTG